jgi:hypothetical protein
LGRNKKEEVADDGYTVRYVAFVDILGFAALVRSAENSAERRGEIIHALKTVCEQEYAKQCEVRTHSFSDSLILSADRTPTGLWGLIVLLEALAWNLLQIGVLARGAISVGGIYHDDRIVFGTGVNEAHRLESTVAKYPRIMLSKQAVEDTYRYANDETDRANLIWNNVGRSRLIRDADGVMFIHFLSEMFCMLSDKKYRYSAEAAEYATMGQRAQTIIQTKIAETLDAPDVYDKVKWLGAYWNNTLEAHATEAPNMPLSPIILAGYELKSPRSLKLRYVPIDFST